MKRLDGKVALITGAARGQGRSHAIRLAEEGADVIAVDICRQIDSVVYPMSTPSDLAETVKLVEDYGSRIIAHEADVRDHGAMASIVAEGVAELGHIDIVLCNAGILNIIGEPGSRTQAWHDSIDVMLTGVFNTIDVVVPPMIEHGTGGSIVITSSTAGLKVLTPSLVTSPPGCLGYHAAKHGLVGLMKVYAKALGQYNIRVNTVHPTGVNTPMVANEDFPQWVQLHPELTGTLSNALPVDMVEAVDVSNMIAWLCSEEARYVTGSAMPVDAGFLLG
jgi:SDR family mycofactocin-dependent oxidoreductase